MSDDKAALKDVVADYLRTHPDFLIEHPDLLEHMELQHGSGSAVSLIERQVEQLRSANEEVRDRLNRLVGVAAENEQLMSRLHRLTLELMPIDAPGAFFAHLDASLEQEFGIDVLSICLFDSPVAVDAGDDVFAVTREDAALDPFRKLLDDGQALCGRLSESKLGFLFGERAEQVRSTALVPLGEQGRDGLMALGSADPDRFFPGMGTLFLGLLADVITARLALSRPTEQRRSA
jgi:uncharacterized protein